MNNMIYVMMGISVFLGLCGLAIAILNHIGHKKNDQH